MTYRDILVQIDERPQAFGRAQAAAALARQTQAHLTGLFLKSEFRQDYLISSPLSYFPPAELNLLIQEHAAAVDKAAEEARQLFERAAAQAGVSSDWRTLEGDLRGGLLSCARRSDLTVVPAMVTVSLSGRKLGAGDLGLATGGPILVMPETDVAAPVGKDVLVAWKGARESARALKDAWPLIEAADNVHVLVVSPQGEGGPDGLLQRHFERHGCTANLIVDHSEDATASQLIRHHVRDLKCDLVVLGLYGRPRLQELILGGVTRELLRDPPAALFMSH